MTYDYDVIVIGSGPGGEGARPWVHVAPLPDVYRGPIKAKDPRAGEKYAAHVGDLVDATRAAGRRIAVVPTMGALHRGHTSLIAIARQRADVVVTTVFVNPTQFGPGEDLSRYPRDIEQDENLHARPTS